LREFSTPATYVLPEHGNLTDDIITNAAEQPDDVAFSRRVGTTWEDVTAVDFLAEVRELAKGLIATGVSEGDRVALISKTRYEWTLVDYAIWSIGAVTVPIYETSSIDQISWILTDSGARAVFAETDALRASVEQAGGTKIWSIDSGGMAELFEEGEQIADGKVEERRKSRVGTDLATPLLVAPTAFQCLADPEGEVATGRAVHATGSLMVVSTLGTRTLEDVAATGTPRWFQLYIHKDRGLTRHLVERAEAAGYTPIVPTLDTPRIGIRYADQRNRFQLPDGLEVANLAAHFPDAAQSGLAPARLRRGLSTT